MKKIIITILTLALITTVFASCTKTEIETTTYEPVIEFPTEEITSEEVTTETPTTMQEETTTEVPSTEEATTEAPTTEVPTTKEPETTTKAPVAETTTEKKPEVTTEKVTEENTTEAGPLKEFATPEPTTKVKEDLNFIGGSTISPERAGLIYDGAGRLSSYDKIPEGSKYYEYDKNGVEHLKTKPYSKGNEPEPMRCEYCGKETKPYDGKHYGSYYGYCDRFLASMTCCECGEFVQANTCHTCK